MKTVAKAWTFPSSSSGATYETLKYTDGSTSCNCPGWTRRTDARGNRSCKHTRAVDMNTADFQAQSFVNYQEPAPGRQSPPTRTEPAAPVQKRRFQFADEETTR